MVRPFVRHTTGKNGERFGWAESGIDAKVHQVREASVGQLHPLGPGCSRTDACVITLLFASFPQKLKAFVRPSSDHLCYTSWKARVNRAAWFDIRTKLEPNRFALTRDCKASRLDPSLKGREPTARPLGNPEFPPSHAFWPMLAERLVCHDENHARHCLPLLPSHIADRHRDIVMHTVGLMKHAKRLRSTPDILRAQSTFCSMRRPSPHIR